MRPAKSGVALTLCFGFLVSIAQANSDTAIPTTPATPPEFGKLFVAEGVDTTFYTCTACHSERIVAQQGFTRKGWDELFIWMVEEQGMMEIEEPDRSAILDYLATNYNTDRPNFPRP